MRGHRIIEESGKWRFEFMPINSKTQPVGWSRWYDSSEDCRKAIRRLHTLIIENQISTHESPYIQKSKDDKGHCFCYCVDGEKLFRVRAHTDSVASIHKNIDEYVLHRVYSN